MIVRGQAKLTLGRLHYVRATREEAASVSISKSHHSDNKWDGHQANGEIIDCAGAWGEGEERQR
jgi:hypothetical protein